MGKNLLENLNPYAAKLPPEQVPRKLSDEQFDSEAKKLAANFVEDLKRGLRKLIKKDENKEDRIKRAEQTFEYVSAEVVRRHGVRRELYCAIVEEIKPHYIEAVEERVKKAKLEPGSELEKKLKRFARRHASNVAAVIAIDRVSPETKATKPAKNAQSSTSRGGTWSIDDLDSMPAFDK